jgi:hypothetical protein
MRDRNTGESSVHTMIIDGRIVVGDREINTVDEEKARAKCQELSKEVLERGGVNPIHTRWKVV